MDRRTTPLEALGKSASAYEHLKHLAIKGELRPGRRLSTPDLADYFHVSVTPIRDALVRLAAEGFIVWEMSHGHFIKPYTLEEQRDLLELSYILTLYGMKRAADNGPMPFLEAFTRLENPDPEGQNQIEDCLARMEDLQMELAALSGNEILRSRQKVLIDRTHFVRLLALREPDGLTFMIPTLRGLAGALLARDLSEAEKIAHTAFQARLARLPVLVDQANTHALQARFP